MSEQNLAYLLAGISALLWGFAVIPIKAARTSGRLGVAVSMATGTLVMALLSGASISQLGTLTSRELGLYLLVGAFQFAIGCMLYYMAIHRGSISIAVPITRVKIILILFMSVALGMEIFRWSLLWAAMLVFMGGALLGKPSSKADTLERGGHWRSIALAIGACISWAIGETLIGLLPDRIPPITSNGMMLGCGLVVYALYAAVSGAWREVLAMPRHDVICYMGHGLISFSAAYALFVWAMQLSTPPRVVTITSTYPLISALIGWIAYKERFSIRLVIGAILIIGGVIVLQFV
ncbi:MAG: EamA family transporter [candidate division WS1 bacterium]|jgi:drug/metabolite transporter (DMT)-like permease|nr:EamA family transporter [candidate division WS1 bacterium]